MTGFPAEVALPAGTLFRREIREQPEALRRLLAAQDELTAVGRALRERAPSFVRLVGHGTSDNAAAYGVYAFGLLAGRTAFRDSISLAVYYGVEQDFEQSAVIALSQSGRTPDVVAYVERARARGALTIGITNEPDSELGRAAELVVPLCAGPELAVAATKTYTTQLAALALLAAAAGGREKEAANALQRTTDLMETSLDRLERIVPPIAVSFAFVGRMFVIGRGVEFATAREIALKLTETCRIVAEPLTSTDLAHGPIAALDPLFPVWAIASRDQTLATVVEATARVREAGAMLIASGEAAAAIVGAPLTIPTEAAPWAVLSPLLSVVPGQLFAGALAEAKGLDPDRPVGLQKVTLAA